MEELRFKIITEYVARWRVGVNQLRTQRVRITANSYFLRLPFLVPLLEVLSAIN